MADRWARIWDSLTPEQRAQLEAQGYQPPTRTTSGASGSGTGGTVEPAVAGNPYGDATKFREITGQLSPWQEQNLQSWTDGNGQVHRYREITPMPAGLNLGVGGTPPGGASLRNWQPDPNIPAARQIERPMLGRPGLSLGALQGGMGVNGARGLSLPAQNTRPAAAVPATPIDSGGMISGPSPIDSGGLFTPRPAAPVPAQTRGMANGGLSLFGGQGQSSGLLPRSRRPGTSFSL